MIVDIALGIVLAVAILIVGATGALVVATIIQRNSDLIGTCIAFLIFGVIVFFIGRWIISNIDPWAFVGFILVMIIGPMLLSNSKNSENTTNISSTPDQSS